MLIAHLSDTHITGWGQKAYGVVPTAKNLENCIQHINQLIPRPDVVLVTGDITNSGTSEETMHAACILAGLQIPYYIIPGNHDSRGKLYSAFEEQAYMSGSDKFINYTIDNFPLRLIALDSVDEGFPGGKLCNTRIKWLKERLDENKEQPTIIFTHHPPIKCSLLETDVDGFIGADQLGDILTEYDNVERVLCGHIHLVTHTRWKNTIVTTAPSMGLKLELDLTMTEPSRFIPDCPAYLLHHWTDQNNLVSHLIEVKKEKNIYPF